MDCGVTRDWLLQADRPGDRPAAVADHVRGCDSCAALAARIERLDGALRDEPLPNSAHETRDAFLRRLATTPAQPVRRGVDSPRWAVAALMLFALGLGAMLVLPGTPARASSDVVDRLIDWNLNLADAGDRDDVVRRFAAAEPALSNDLDRLATGERELAETLLATGRWLAAHDDPVETAVRIHDVADRLFDKLRKASDRGDARQSQQFARRFGRVAERGLDANFDRAAASAALTPEQKKRLDQLERKAAKRQQALAELHARMPAASKKELRQALESTRKKPKSKSEPTR